MKDRIDVTVLGICAVLGGFVSMVCLIDCAEKFALYGGGATIIVGFMCWIAVIVDIYKSRIKAKIYKQLKAVNGYHILKTFRKIYEEL